MRIGRTFISCESWHNRITPESVESFRNYWTKLVKWLICSCGFEVSVSYYWIYFHKLDTTCLNLSYSNYLTKTMVLYQIIFIILFYSNYLYFSICKFSLCNLHKQMDFPFFLCALYKIHKRIFLLNPILEQVSKGYTLNSYILWKEKQDIFFLCVETPQIQKNSPALIWFEWNGSKKRNSGEKRKIVLLMDCDVWNGIGDDRGISEIWESS